MLVASAAASCASKVTAPFSSGSNVGQAGSGSSGLGVSSGQGGLYLGDASCNECSDAAPVDDGGPPMENPTKVAGMKYADFPAAPVIDTSDTINGTPPNNSPQLFGPATQGASSGGPCMIEPEPNALLPRNWLRPRFRWFAPEGETLFELRVHVTNQIHDLVVYTTASEWTMPATIWSALHEDSYDEALVVTVRGGSVSSGSLDGEALGSVAQFAIAPVAAPGSIVYWTTTNGTALKGFRIGDESVELVLTPPQVAQYSGSATCIGCHTATPDGQFASFAIQAPWAAGLANIQPGQLGGTFASMGSGAKSFLASASKVVAFGINTYSPAHWVSGDHVEISMYLQQSELAWIDLEASDSSSAFGIIARNGDPQLAGAPSWSHDGKTIAYVSTTGTQDGRLSHGPADLYTVPYNNRAGGSAKPVMGASDPNALEYYPAYSPDDQYLAFTKITGPDTSADMRGMYNNPAAEVNVIPSGGGSATRLAANDPPSCSMEISPGVTNSWPKLAPEVGIALDGRTFYWIVFSSTRDPFLDHGPQLYVTAVVVDSYGSMTTYGALYLWNQPETEHNHTPAWENFRIPPVTTVVH